MSDHDADEPGGRFEDRYELGHPIGAGASSEVYEARDRRSGRTVAIKLLSEAAAADPAARERFEREVQVGRRLAHPNLLTVVDHGTLGGRPFLVTELFAGKPLAERMRERLAAGQVFRILEQVLDGLEAVHANGIVHRDLKPANILVGDSGDLAVKITDFGVAKPMMGPTRGPATAQGVVLGTPAYMAPEQVAGQPCTASTDLYAVAVMFYELAVGTHPFPTESSADMLRAQLLAEPRIPWSLHPALRRVLERGLEKSPSARFAGAPELRRALRVLEREVLAGSGVVHVRSGPVRIPVQNPSGAIRVARRARRTVVAMGLACATLITALLVALPALRWAIP